MGKVKGAVEKPNRTVTDEMVDKFAHDVIVLGYKLTEAWGRCHPSSEAKWATRKHLASDFAARPDVQARMQEIREEMRKTRESFRERLVQYHIDDIEACVREEHNLANCMEQVKSLNKIMGYEQTKVAVEAKVAAVDESALDDKLKFLLGKEAAKA